MKGEENIILIGPLAAGKSSIAEKISSITGLHNHPVDRLKWYYRHKNGYDLFKSTHELRTKGFPALIEYAKNYFGPKELACILDEFHGIIDLGATDTHSDELSRLRELIALFEHCPNVFLILPCKSAKQSIAILNARLENRYKNDQLKLPVIDSYRKMNEIFVRSKTNKMLAKHVIYVNNKSIDQIATEILQKTKFRFEIQNEIMNQKQA